MFKSHDITYIFKFAYEERLHYPWISSLYSTGADINILFKNLFYIKKISSMKTRNSEREKIWGISSPYRTTNGKLIELCVVFHLLFILFPKDSLWEGDDPNSPTDEGITSKQFQCTVPSWFSAGVSHHFHIHHFPLSTFALSEQYPGNSPACFWDLLAQVEFIFPYPSENFTA